MLKLTHSLPTATRLAGILKTRVRELRDNKLVGGSLGFALIATSIIPTTNSNIQANLAMPETTSLENIKLDASIITGGNTQIKTQEGLQMPVQGVYLSQGFFSYHPGVDLAGKIGSRVSPIMAGTIESVQFSKYDYGNAIIINHGNGITSLYAHLSKIEVKVGDVVNVNTEIGKTGTTGHSTGPHLHLEIRDHNFPLNPITFLSAIGKLPRIRLPQLTLTQL
jgi:murein DD-endopeptidase MepM/ murein hydrolase activator NlpD